MKKFPQVLGYLGALPFLGLAFVVFSVQGENIEADIITIKLFALFQLGYACLILSFLAGVHWPEALKERDNIRLTLSMLPTIIGFALLMWGMTHDPVTPLLGTIALFWFVFIMDKKYYDGRIYPDGYLPFRFNLTLLVTAILIFTYFKRDMKFEHDMNKQYDLIIFDCDGTLVNSHDMNHAIMAEIANQYGDFSYSLESVEKEYLGIDYAKFFKMVSIKENVTIPDEAAKQCVEMAHERIPTMMKKIEGTHEALERLAPHYKLNVASNANLKIVQDSLKALALDPYFDLDKIMAGRIMATPKPAPDLFLAAARNMNVEPARCLVIEDSATGVQAGMAAGMDVWASTAVARDAESAEKLLKNAGAARVFTSFIHMADALGV